VKMIEVAAMGKESSLNKERFSFGCGECDGLCMTSDFIKYSNFQDVRKLQNPEVDAGFMSRLLSVRHGFDQIVSKLGNEAVIGKPREPTPVNV